MCIQPYVISWTVLQVRRTGSSASAVACCCLLLGWVDGSVQICKVLFSPETAEIRVFLYKFTGLGRDRKGTHHLGLRDADYM